MPAASSDTRPPLPALGFVMLALLTLAWGTNWPIIKIAVSEMSPWTFRALSVPTGGFIMLLATRLSGQSLAVPGDKWPALVAVSLFNITGWHVFSSFGVSFMASGRASLIAFTMPLWASILAVFVLGETLTARGAVALGLGMAGIGVLLSDQFGALAAAPVGYAFMLGAALTWAVGTMIQKRVAWNMPTVAVAGWQLLIGGLPIVAVFLATEAGELKPVSGAAVAAVFYITLVPMSLGTYAWFKVVSLFPVGVSAIGTLMIPVVAVVTAGVALGEPVGWREVSAIALICPALALVLIHR